MTLTHEQVIWLFSCFNELPYPVMGYFHHLTIAFLEGKPGLTSDELLNLGYWESDLYQLEKWIKENAQEYPDLTLPYEVGFAESGEKLYSLKMPSGGYTESIEMMKKRWEK